jgi:hypothetical protein
VDAPPRSFLRALHDAALVAGALALCPVAAVLAPSDPAGPVARARDVVALERDTGLFVEPAAHAWASGRPWLLAAACVFYVWVHLPAVIGALVWAWLERPAAFPAVRDVFLLAQALTVAGYLLVPTAPPRMLPGLGFSDTLSGFWGAGAAAASHSVQSPYAALPSGHVVFALVASGAVALLARPLAVRLLALAYPPLVVAVTVVTANHFVVDAVAGALVVALSAAIVGFRQARRTPTVPSRANSTWMRSPPATAIGGTAEPAMITSPALSRSPQAPSSSAT